MNQPLPRSARRDRRRRGACRRALPGILRGNIRSLHIAGPMSAPMNSSGMILASEEPSEAIWLKQTVASAGQNLVSDEAADRRREGNSRMGYGGVKTGDAVSASYGIHLSE
jgi:hypothetical protein